MLGVAITLVLMVGTALATQADAIADSPPILLMPVGLVLAVAILSTAMMRSDREHRTKAVVDPLTGMLNRQALSNRVEELRQQSAFQPAPVGIVVIDIDHFKAVNDSVGHAMGDRVLQEVAYIIRKGLRAYDLAYRLGGEEFVVLLPGANRQQSGVMAARLCETVAGARFAHGDNVTISCGVASSPAGVALDYEAVFTEADAAMYLAKGSGRNCVRGHEAPDLSPALA